LRDRQLRRPLVIVVYNDHFPRSLEVSATRDDDTGTILLTICA
jgi:hypothetical protein